jgi:uncharacterized protein (UPF0335 family)
MAEAEPAPSNGYPKTKVKDFVKRVETLEADIEDAHMKYMSKVGKIKADISDVLDEAKAAGLPRKELKKVLQTRKKEKQIEKLRDDLESDEQDRFDLLRLALGDLEDTELGKAALDRQAALRKEQEENLAKLGKGKGDEEGDAESKRGGTKH